jgi:hypothetical protein
VQQRQEMRGDGIGTRLELDTRAVAREVVQ